MRKEGVEIDVLFIDGSKRKLNYLWGIFRLWGRLLSHRYDLIHAHYVFSGMVARFQFLYPVVLTHHGLEVFMTWQRFPSRLIIPLVNRVILVSQQQMEKLRCRNGKAVVIPCGIDMGLFQPTPRDQARKQLGLPLDKKLVLFFGHTRREKRYDIARAAADMVSKQDPTAELLLVSDKPHETMPLYMSACDVLLLVSDGEGSPTVVKEAMACDLPVVSVAVGDVPEVIEGTEGCYLCKQDPADAAAKLQSALGRGKRTNGREKIGRMEMGVTARRILAVYRELVPNEKHT